MAAEARQLLGRRKGLTELARQAPRLLVLPAALESAISTFLREHSSKELKMNVSLLSGRLRNAEEHSGRPDGLGGAPLESENVETIGGSAAARDALEDYIFAKPTRLAKLRPKAAVPEEPVLYTEKSTAAYIAARMPAIYGAVHRVLLEVSRRVPDFTPSRLLDFGSGPGTAFWAANEVWQGELKAANLVEPCQAMINASRDLLKDVQSLPSIRTYSSLLELSKIVRQKPREHNLVVSSYTLGELPTMDDRITAVRQLWSFTSGMLVLIEPGTPEGSSTVREMRSHILQLERKKLRRQKQGPQLFKDGTPVPATEDSPLLSKAVGAFVVAPCSHDGACPMDGLSTFCHFSQRVQRTPFQRISKRQGPAPLRAYEDEKFSFVVLHRGSRPSGSWPLDDLGGSSSKTYESEEDVEFLEFDSSDNVLDDASIEATMDSDFESDSESPDSKESSIAQMKPLTGDDAHMASLSGGWARVVRQPLRRGRHVLLDICRSAERDGSRGSLSRVICARKAKLAQHLRAKKLMWGDLWPC